MSIHNQFFLNRALYLLKNPSFPALLTLEIMGIMDHHHGPDLRGGYTPGQSGVARGGFVLYPQQTHHEKFLKSVGDHPVQCTDWLEWHWIETTYPHRS